MLSGLLLTVAALSVLPQVLPEFGVFIGNQATPFANLMIGYIHSIFHVHFPYRAYASYFALLTIALANTKNRLVVYIIGVGIVVIRYLIVKKKGSFVVCCLLLSKPQQLLLVLAWLSCSLDLDLLELTSRNHTRRELKKIYYLFYLVISFEINKLERRTASLGVYGSQNFTGLFVIVSAALFGTNTY